MPSGVYKRKPKTVKNNNKRVAKRSLQNKYELVLATMDTVNLILRLVKDLKKNKIGKIK